jgi:LCP family protein required for cell wall assembly
MIGHHTSPVPTPDDEQGRPEDDASGRVPYTRYRARPRLFGGGREPDLGTLREPQPSGRRTTPRPPWRRVVAWLALAVTAWIALSVVAFVVSATVHQSSFGGAKLDGGGTPPFGATTILVLGTDARPKGSKEPGANAGPARADTIMLVRIGGGHNAKLSIPRDTAAAIPGHGTQKINAAYAFGGVALMVDTVRDYLGIEIDHVVEIDFENFPKLIDAMGGIDYRGSCVVGRINGGARNGGVTVRLKAGKHHLDGKHALALARVRKNECNKREDDLSRARRQQKILSAMKSRAISFQGLLRGPFIGWNAPRAIKSDMAGPSLLGVAAAFASSGAGQPRVLRGAPTGNELVVSDAAKQAAVRRFLDG